MDSVLHGISHFLGICVGIIIILMVLGIILHKVPNDAPPKKKTHYHMVYKKPKNNYNNNKTNTVEGYNFVSNETFSLYN
jgi:uncharacterized membrane protein required for colicin V production